jgi:hypothetical protein
MTAWAMKGSVFNCMFGGKKPTIDNLKPKIDFSIVVGHCVHVVGVGLVPRCDYVFGHHNGSAEYCLQ